jgi:hypothetical protein
MFNCDGSNDDGGIWGTEFLKAYEAESGRVWDYNSADDYDYDAVRTDPVAINLVKRMSVDRPWRSKNVGIAWIPLDLFEYVVLDKDDYTTDYTTEYVNLSKEKILDQLLELDPNDSKQVERLQCICKRIIAHDIKYEYYYVCGRAE